MGREGREGREGKEVGEERAYLLRIQRERELWAQKRCVPLAASDRVPLLWWRWNFMYHKTFNGSG